MEFRVLGPVEVVSGSERVHVGGRRQAAVLVALLANSNRFLSRHQLVDLVWDDPPDSAEANLRNYLARLRKALAEAGDQTTRIDADEHGYRLRAAPTEVDYEMFTMLATEGDHAADAGDHVRAVDRFERAAALFRGEPFGGTAIEGGLSAIVAHLTERRDQVRFGALRSRLELGQADGILQQLDNEVLADPANEPLVGLYMLALHRSRRTQAAVNQFRRLRDHLDSELGIEPGVQLTRLYRDILADFDSTRGPTLALAQLPASVSTFTGRQRELNDICSHITRTLCKGGMAAVALSGVAGVGKTALAVRAARQLESQFPDGQLYLDLRGSTGDGDPMDSQRAVTRLLRALGVNENAIPTNMDDCVRSFRRHISGRRMLVVLDNAESPHQVLPLVPQDAGCAVIVTSRSAFAEANWVRNFEVRVLDSGDAVQLFCKVSGAPPDPAIVDIIEACGRLPLTIRRTARRLRGRPGWSTQQMSNRLTASGGWRIHRFN